MKDDAERARECLAIAAGLDESHRSDAAEWLKTWCEGAVPVETAIAAMLAFAQPPEGWRPIETAPKDGSMVDLWQGGERWPNCYWEGGMWWRGCLQNPTHWRQPPAPPAAMLDVAPIPGGE